MPHLAQFIDASPSPYHAVQALASRLLAAGYIELSEADTWKLSAHRSYFCIRGGKSIVAWKTGAKPASDVGFRIIAAHTDSPALKVKPNPIKKFKNTLLLTAEIYGSPLLYTWMDRDLKISGIIYYKQKGEKQILSKLVDLAQFPLRASSLAPHFRSDYIKTDSQNDLTFFLETMTGAPVETGKLLHQKFFSDVDQLISFDLFLSDIQKSLLSGLNQEFLSAPRIDNLVSCYCAIDALCNTATYDSEYTHVAACFDSEEIGSQTWGGARSSLLPSILQRIVACEARNDAQSYDRARAKSLIVSVDMAHAEHPGAPDCTDETYAPELNLGLALKYGTRGNYAESRDVMACYKDTCDGAGIPFQEFMYRADQRGGSSLGPIISSVAGIRGIDIGVPMLGMHSIRELCGVKDIANLTKSLQLFLDTEFDFNGRHLSA